VERATILRVLQGEREKGALRSTILLCSPTWQEEIHEYVIFSRCDDREKTGVQQSLIPFHFIYGRVPVYGLFIDLGRGVSYRPPLHERYRRKRLLSPFLQS